MMRFDRIMSLLAFVLIAFQQMACAAEEPRLALTNIKPVISMFGKELTPPDMEEESLKAAEITLARAQAAYDKNPDDVENIIWLGSAKASLWAYHEAIETYSEGLRKFPDNYRLLRHRAHRYVSTRQFDKAIADFERAAALIKGVPDHQEVVGPFTGELQTVSNHWNIWYHMGLAYYLKGDYENALRCYRENTRFVYGFDGLVANSDWMYMTLRRLGRNDEAQKVLAPVYKGMNVLEDTYYLRRLLMYKGELSLEYMLQPVDYGDSDTLRSLFQATQTYGVANWYLYNDQPQKGKALLRQLVDKNPFWAAFGYIAAEVDLHRMAN